jgi:hypothetical protein
MNTIKTDSDVNNMSTGVAGLITVMLGAGGTQPIVERYKIAEAHNGMLAYCNSRNVITRLDSRTANF